MKKLFALAIFLVVGCGPTAAPTKKVISLDEMQGKWKIVHVTDPDGKGYEGDQEIVITGNKAVSEGLEIRMAFNPEGNLEMFAQVPKDKNNPGGEKEEKKIGEVTVEQNIEPPLVMLWADKNNAKQETVLKKSD